MFTILPQAKMYRFKYFNRFLVNSKSTQRKSNRSSYSTTKKIVFYLFRWCNLTGHIDINYHYDCHSVSLTKKSGFEYRIYKSNIFLSFYFVLYHFLQTWRCFYIYQDKIMFLVATCWVNGFCMRFFGHAINSILTRNQRVITLSQVQVFKCQQNVFRENKYIYMIFFYCCSFNSENIQVSLWFFR